MLLNDAQIALNDLDVNCQDAADHYEDAAGMVEDEALAMFFRELAVRRREASEELSAHIRRMGGMPRTTDGDRETVQRLLTRLRANLSADKCVALLTEREHVEDHLTAMTETALQQDLPDDTKSHLRQLKCEFRDTQRRLAEVKESRQRHPPPP
jgi:uncharacterized protein (TIGR02284 family)